MGNIWFRSQERSTGRFKNKAICNSIKLPRNIASLDLSKYDIANNEILYDVLNRIRTPLKVKQLRMVGKNGVTEIPLVIGRFENLENLDFSNNCIEHIPWSVVYLRHLQTLNLSHNMLTKLPRVVGQLGELKRLDLKGNQLVHLPADLILLDHLEELDLSLNEQLSSPPVSVALKGVHEIFRYFERQKSRSDIWASSTPWVGHVNDCQGGRMKTLHELCICTILLFKVDFLAPTFLPPRLKSYLTVESDEYQNCVKLAKCSTCRGYFSTAAKFDNHHCQSNVDNSTQIEERARQESPVQLVKCSACSKYFTSEDAVNEHACLSLVTDPVIQAV